jgi:mRNA degradation ribonuclease J1/J2
MGARLGQWNRGGSFAAIRSDWLARAGRLGRPVRIALPDGERSMGSFEGIDERGHLILRLADGSVQTIATGDVLELVFAPLGGVGEIGMNLSRLRLGDERRRTWLAVDSACRSRRDSLPGIDVIMPDIRFLGGGAAQPRRHRAHPRARGPFRRAARPWPQAAVPVYATPFTAALIRGQAAFEPGAPDVPSPSVALGSRFNVGPFDIELVSMAHSIPESNALIIRTPLGNVLHTGDWKLDPTPVLGPPTDEAKLRGRSATRACSR